MVDDSPVDDSPYQDYRLKVTVEFDLDIQAQNGQNAFTQAQTYVRDKFVHHIDAAEAVVIKIDHAVRTVDTPSFKF